MSIKIVSQRGHFSKEPRLLYKYLELRGKTDRVDPLKREKNEKYNFESKTFFKKKSKTFLKNVRQKKSIFSSNQQDP